MNSEVKYPNFPIMLVRTAQYISGYNVTQPLGIMCLASVLRCHGYQNIRLVDMRPDLMETKQVIKQIREFCPRFLGLSSLSYEVPTVAEIVEAVRKFDSEIHICVGGPFPSSMKEKTLDMVTADSIVIGEGEKTIIKLIDAIADAALSPREVPLNGIPGVFFRHNGTVSGTSKQDYIQDLDQLPLPAWDMINITKYFGIVNFNFFLKYPNYMSIMTTRGCPYRCAYCHNVLGKAFRKRSVDSVMREIHTLVKNYGIREFHIIDDSFNLDLDRAKVILDEMAKIRPSLAIAFPNGVRGDRLDEEFLVKAKVAGMYKINFAIETASPRLQKKIKKNLDLGKVREMIQISDRLNIICHGFFMLGFPTETKEEMLQTVDFALTAPLHTANFFIVQPFEGTDIYNMFKEQHSELTLDPKHYNYYEANFEIYEIPRKHIQNIIKDAHKRFFFTPWRLLKLIRLIPRKSTLFRGALRLVYRGFLGKG
jgi:radical SAM superfamily enzyme YgiQ (UPF0313 family)